jgi:hydroxyacylglutathione hydrolase
MTGTGDPVPGRIERVAPAIRRILAPNRGPYTFHGTNTYLVGDRDTVVIDPGPDDAGHRDALLAATAGRIAAIVLTHGHLDHAGAAAALAAATGAPILASPSLGAGGEETTGATALPVPDRTLRDGDRIATPAGDLVVVETPGHSADHLALALEGSGHAFSGDHVMAWSTTVVIPPGGSMADYMASLDRLAARPERTWWPGHGGPVVDGPARAAELGAHRRAREAMILAAVRGGDGELDAIVSAVYAGLAPALVDAARLSARAHLDWLAEKGLVAREPDGRWRPA